MDIQKRGGIIITIVRNVLLVPGYQPALRVVLGLKKLASHACCKKIGDDKEETEQEEETGCHFRFI